MPERRLVTRSEADTTALGRDLAADLRAGDVVLLEGVLGAGKTALARGIASGLGVPEDEVRSPTFTLVNPYAGGRLPVYHVDLYRIASARDLDELGLEEILGTDGVAIVEWAERLDRWRPPHALVIRFEDRGGSERSIVIDDGRTAGGAWSP